MDKQIRLWVGRHINDRFKLNTEGLAEKYDAFAPEWRKLEDKVLQGLHKITGLTFKRNIIDVFLINPDDAPSVSFPLILKAYGTVEKTICVLVHELIHSLLWDNNENNDWAKKIMELHPQETRRAAIHVAVHAILEAVYVEVLNNPEAIAKDIKDHQEHPDYKRAWEIVKEEGYKNVIAKLKENNGK